MRFFYAQNSARLYVGLFGAFARMAGAYTCTPTSFSPAPAQIHGAGKNNNNRDNAMTISSNTNQAEQTISATNKSTIDFSHRLADPDLEDSVSLVDNISLMTDRASGVLNLLFWNFQRSDVTGRPSDAAFCMAIDSVMREIDDIKATVNAYCDADIAKGQVQS